MRRAEQAYGTCALLATAHISSPVVSWSIHTPLSSPGNSSVAEVPRESMPGVKTRDKSGKHTFMTGLGA